MNKSESIKNLAVALGKFQGEVKNAVNSADNPFFKSKYAPLNEILNDVRPLLAKNGLSVIQMPGGDGSVVTMTTTLLHESGEWIESPELTLKADKATAQGAGSAITYARRYSLSAVLGITSEDDDDGNIASGNQNQPKQSKPANKKVDVGEQAVMLQRCIDAGKVLDDEKKKKIFAENFPGKSVDKLSYKDLETLHELIKEAVLNAS